MPDDGQDGGGRGQRAQPEPAAASAAPSRSAPLLLRRGGVSVRAVGLGRQRPDRADAGEHGRAQGARAGVSRGLVGDQRGGFAQAGHLGLAVAATGQVPLEGLALGVVEGVDDVGPGQRVQ